MISSQTVTLSIMTGCQANHLCHRVLSLGFNLISSPLRFGWRTSGVEAAPCSGPSRPIVSWISVPRSPRPLDLASRTCSICGSCCVVTPTAPSTAPDGRAGYDQTRCRLALCDRQRSRCRILLFLSKRHGRSVARRATDGNLFVARRRTHDPAGPAPRCNLEL
jgi:hypothetical protein